MLNRLGPRLKLPALALISMLGAAVFFWGLHYKLSLYQCHLTAHNTPAAKLLSQKERPACSVQTATLLPSQRAPQARTKMQSGTSLALPASARLRVAREHGTLLLAGLLPGAPHGRYLASSNPRAPPVAA